jgi:hypothetical protein
MRKGRLALAGEVSFAARLGQLSEGSSSVSDTQGALSVGLRLFARRGVRGPFVGAGLGVLRQQANPDGWNDDEVVRATGAAWYAEAGVAAGASGRFRARLRLDTPLFDLTHVIPGGARWPELALAETYKTRQATLSLAAVVGL